MNEFEIINDGSHLPIVCYKLKDKNAQEWNLFDLADRLRMTGWQVPAYPLPKNLDKIEVQRIVCRADLGMNMAHDFIQDLRSAIHDLNNAHIMVHKDEELKNYGFTH